MPPISASLRGEEIAAEILGAEPGRALPIAAVEALCRLACSDDPAEAQAGTDAIFRRIVEYWGDRFEPAFADRYLEFFSALIECARRIPAAHAFDGQLRKFSIDGAEALLRRYQRQRLSRPAEAKNMRLVRKVFVISRVTLGADVAVTSVFLAAARQVFPAAEILFVGGLKAAALFAGDESIRLIRLEYERGGTLIGRLDAWRQAVRVIEQEIQALKPDEFAVLDPDSRITQLGLLPLASPDDASYFFESRTYGAESALPLGELSARWLRQVFGEAAEGLLPFVRLSGEDLDLGEQARRSIAGPVAAVNLGVGGNAAKRLGEAFESNLLRVLFLRGYSVVLDHGAGPDEFERTGRLIETCRREGVTVGELRTGRCEPARLLAFQGSLSAFGGIIAASDLYVGYDSAGGHLAAASGVPGIDIFAGAPCERMRQRWSPWGKLPATVVAAPPRANLEEVLAAVEKLIP